MPPFFCLRVSRADWNFCTYLSRSVCLAAAAATFARARAQVRLISRLCDFYLVFAMVPLFTASGMSRKKWDIARIDTALAEYHRLRNQLSLPLFTAVDTVAAMRWTESSRSMEP